MSQSSEDNELCYVSALVKALSNHSSHFSMKLQVSVSLSNEPV